MFVSHLLQVIAILTHLALSQTMNQTQPARSNRGTLRFTYYPNITRVTIDNPPINLFDLKFGTDLVEFMLSIQPTNSTATSTIPAALSPPPKVVIFDSADPEIFASHLDLNGALDPEIGKPLFSQLYTFVSLLRNTTTVAFISQVNGLATGAGNEFMIQTDIRFAGPKTRASQLETAAGLVAGAGGIQALPRLINRGRGLQYLLASQAVDGPTGAELGWFNEYFDNATSLENAVEELAKRIALFPLSTIQATKSGLLGLWAGAEAYQRDQENLVKLGGEPEEQGVIRRILELGQNQSRTAFELGLPDTLLQLWGLFRIVQPA